MGVNQGVPEKRELFNVALLALQGKEKCEKGSELLSKTGDLVATEQWDVQDRIAAARAFYRHDESLIAAVHEYLKSNCRRDNNMLICTEFRKEGFVLYVYTNCVQFVGVIFS